MVLLESGSSDLLLVLLPASLGCSVVLLPLLALGLEAFLPLVGLRVKAVRVLVVALLVVLGEHSVECRIELGTVGVNALVGLLEAQRDTTTLEVDVDDLDEDLVAHGDDLLGKLNVLARELRDVDETLDALGNTNKRARRERAS